MAQRLLFPEWEMDEGTEMREKRSGSFVDNVQAAGSPLVPLLCRLLREVDG